MKDKGTETWSEADEIHLELYTQLTEVMRIGQHNSLLFFAYKLIEHDVTNTRVMTQDECHTIDTFFDQAIEVDRILQTHLGKTYIADYLKKLETDND